ncbi:MAG TPA: DUF1385 domain-containing protein [Candidatus Nanoarchaeia archaeon]|nr:DUF1385 domain-containing protein [Candidatus Nanoarchaeia archaeon]
MEFVGGQAVIEGVMMRNGDNVAVAVLDPEGKIILKKERYNFLNLKIPFIRGMVSLVEVLYVGLKTLNYSSNIAVGGTEEKKKIGVFSMIFSTLFALVLAIGLFKFLPLGAASLIDNYFGISNVIFNLIDGFVKIGLFVIYVYSIGKMSDIKRVFQFHGAEHKTVNAYENKLKLTVLNVKKMSKVHRRCGTTFVFLVLFISIFVYTFIPKDYSFFLKLILRLFLLPFIAGIGYEVLKLGAVYEKNWFLNLLITPGLWLQSLTTLEPNEKQIEVAIKSLKAVV